MYYCESLDSPIGQLRLVSDGEALCGLYMGDEVEDQRAPLKRDPGPLREVVRQLRAYFAGELRKFDVPLAAAGTAFQKRVWQALCNIPYGQAISYGELARRVGNPKASRAVGLANGRNPISIIVPCHRVIGANGSLTGYGGGLPRKRWLLEHEGMVFA
ncbi:MAG TPA: methylated-DNA--[protein]-cysteine S-methyltransferase [Nevskiaceae bacterium]|nr:methylated-DNA--[protein]-cysteine S-methyltransferase [Nevskiaceae bacterium]